MRQDLDMKIDLLFDPFGARWPEVRDAALAAEGEGFDGVWLYDHLAGSVHRQDRVLESWTTLTAIAATVPHIAIGPMVLNVANRDAGTLGVMAATLQEVSGGRFCSGWAPAAGAGHRTHPSSGPSGARWRATAYRREAVEKTVSILRSVWTGTVGGVGGFLRPLPRRRSLWAVSGRRWPHWPAGWPTASTCRVDRRRASCSTSRQARAAAGREDSPFVVTVSADLGARSLQRLEALGVDRVVVFLGAPSAARVREVSRNRSVTPSGSASGSAVRVVAGVVAGEPPGEILPGRGAAFLVDPVRVVGGPR